MLDHHKTITEYTEGLLCTLKHGIQFGVWNPKGRLSIRDVADFLRDALEHFEPIKGGVKAYRYASELLEEPGLTGIGRLQLSPPKRLASTCWLEAIAQAQSAVATVQHMLQSSDCSKIGPKLDPADRREIADMAKGPGGDLLAVFRLIRSG